MPFDSTEFDAKRVELVDALTILRSAREGCAQTGWIKGKLASGRARCALGWLWTASGLPQSRDALEPARQYLCPVLPKQFRRDCYTYVAKFNDAPTTTQSDVVALFDRAIARVEGMLAE